MEKSIYYDTKSPMKTRTDLINAVVQHCGVDRYLEIGVAHGTNLLQVKAPHKEGIDPAPHYRADNVHVMASDAYFSANPSQFDLVFVDGNHQMPHPLRDILNALAVSPLVMVHDALPTRDEHVKHGSLYRPGDIWLGQVWQALLYCVEHLGLTVKIWNQDYGVALVYGPYLQDVDEAVAMGYDFVKDYPRLLAYISEPDEILAAAKAYLDARAKIGPQKKTRSTRTRKVKANG